jgi:hypothetical protein
MPPEIARLKSFETLPVNILPDGLGIFDEGRHQLDG